VGTLKIYCSSRNHKKTLIKVITDALNKNKAVEVYPQDADAFVKMGEIIAAINTQVKIDILEGKIGYVIVPEGVDTFAGINGKS